MVKVYKTKTGFDLSKFTVVGTPTITDDGIASGFGSTNYLKSNINIPPNSSIIIKSNIIHSTVGNTSPYPHCKVFWQLSYNNWRLMTAYDNTIQFVGNGTYRLNLNIGTLNEGDLIETETIIINNRITLNAIHNNIKYTISDVLSTTLGEIQNVGIGNFYTGSDYYYTGSIDLKQFSITVDGVEVFNGQRDIYSVVHEYGGYDSSKFTVVGSPTVTSDGIASGFSGSNYLTTSKSIDFANSNEWELDCCVTTPSSFTAINSIYSGNVSYNGIRLTIDASGILKAALSSNTSNYDIGIITGLSFSANTKYYIRLLFKNNIYTLFYSTDGINYYSTGTPITSSLKVMSAVGKIGVNNNNNTPFGGTIDLSQFSITVDNKVVFDGRKDIYKGFNL